MINLLQQGVFKNYHNHTYTYHHLMRKEILLIFFIGLHIHIFAQNEASDKQLASFLNTERWIEMRNFMQSQNRENTINPTLWQIADLLNDYHFNSLDNLSEKTHKIIDIYKNEKNNADGDKVSWLMLLQNHYDYLQDFSNSLKICKDILSIQSEDSFVINKQKEQITLKPFYERLSLCPPLKVKQLPQDTILHYSNPKGTYLTCCDVLCNNEKLTSLIDTGAGMPIMYKKKADQLNVKYIANDTTYINGNTISQRAIIDSLQIGNYIFYNLQIAVLPDIKKEILLESMGDTLEKRISKGMQLDLVWGMPCLRYMKEICFDTQKHVISLPSITSNPISKSPIALIDNTLYARITLNDIPFTGHLDTGLEGEIRINENFYKLNQKKIPIAKDSIVTTMGFTSLDRNIPIKIPTRTNVRIGEGNKNLACNQIWILPNNVFKYDGMIGNFIFREYDTIIFNFEDMWMHVE